MNEDEAKQTFVPIIERLKTALRTGTFTKKHLEISIEAIEALGGHLVDAVRIMSGMQAKVDMALEFHERTLKTLEKVLASEPDEEWKGD